jgi:hypothetical protein
VTDIDWKDISTKFAAIAFCARKGAEATARLRERDKKKDAVPTKGKEEQEEDKKKKKKKEHRAPLHERVQGYVYNLLNNGEFRAQWKRRHREHRENIAAAFCVALVRKEAERGGVVKRACSAELQAFEAMSRGRKMVELRVFLLELKLDTTSSEAIVAMATWPPEFCGEAVPPDTDLESNRVKRVKIANANDDLGEFDEDEEEEEEEEEEDEEEEDEEEEEEEEEDNDNYNNNDDDNNNKKKEQNNDEHAKPKMLRRPRVVAVFPGSKAKFTAPMLPLDGPAMVALFAHARDERVEVRNSCQN